MAEQTKETARKAIVVRSVKMPKWAREALDKSIDAAIERYGLRK